MQCLRESLNIHSTRCCEYVKEMLSALLQNMHVLAVTVVMTEPSTQAIQ